MPSLKRPGNEKKTVFLYVFLTLWFVIAFGCRLYQLEKKLSPEYKEFLSKVRYIVTKEERKIFLELPDSEKKEYSISILEDDLGKEDKIIIDYPLMLKRGTYTLNLELENTAGKEKRKKILKIKMRSPAQDYDYEL